VLGVEHRPAAFDQRHGRNPARVVLGRDRQQPPGRVTGGTRVAAVEDVGAVQPALLPVGVGVDDEVLVEHLATARLGGTGGGPQHDMTCRGADGEGQRGVGGAVRIGGRQ
jgi:hypothetical protein